MKIHLVNTASGLLIPETDADYEAKKNLRIGETYTADIKLVRNSEFHRKFFAMINKAWEFLPDYTRLFYGTPDSFRKTLEVTAGYYEPFYSPKLQEFVQIPRSIAFDKMDEAEFRELYNGVRTVLDSILTRYISSEQFEREFLQF